MLRSLNHQSNFRAFISSLTFLALFSTLIIFGNSCGTEYHHIYPESDANISRPLFQKEQQVVNTEIIAFWDGGYSGLSKHEFQEMNVRTWHLAQNSVSTEVRLIHMNVEEYDKNFLFSFLNRNDFPQEMFDFDSLHPDLKKIVIDKTAHAKEVFSKKYPGAENISLRAKALSQARDGYLLRAYIANKMSPKDLIFSGLSGPDNSITKADLYRYAAVPLSDLVRLQAVSKLPKKIKSRIWLDATVTTYHDLQKYFKLMEKKKKKAFVYYNPFYWQPQIKDPLLKKITGGETWLLATQEQESIIYGRWRDASLEYWVEKDPVKDISQHPLFRKGKSLNFDAYPNGVRNYLWPYAIWSKLALDDPKLFKSSVLPINAYIKKSPYHVLLKSFWLPDFYFDHFRRGLKRDPQKFAKEMRKNWVTKAPGNLAKKFSAMIRECKEQEVPNLFEIVIRNDKKELENIDSRSFRKWNSIAKRPTIVRRSAVLLSVGMATSIIYHFFKEYFDLQEIAEKLRNFRLEKEDFANFIEKHLNKSKEELQIELQDFRLHLR